MSLLSVSELETHYSTRDGVLHAVDDVSFAIEPGETVGLVGESGCGKSTLGKTLLRLVEPTAGSIRFDGVEIGPLRGRELRSFRRRAQMIFQDPFGSLNPRHTIDEILTGPLVVHGIGGRRARAQQIADIGSQPVLRSHERLQSSERLFFVQYLISQLSSPVLMVTTMANLPDGPRWRSQGTVEDRSGTSCER